MLDKITKKKKNVWERQTYTVNKAGISWKVLEIENLNRNPPFMIYWMCDGIKYLNVYLQNGIMLHNFQVYLSSNINNL